MSNILSFKQWMAVKETATTASSVGPPVPSMALGNPGNAFIHGDAQKQAKKCGLAMCPDDLNGNPVKPNKKKEPQITK
jgi:hypothetical protein